MAGGCYCGNYRDAQFLFKTIDINLYPGRFSLVRHVQVENNRKSGLNKLEGKGQHPLQVLGIHHMHDSPQFLFQQD